MNDRKSSQPSDWLTGFTGKYFELVGDQGDVRFVRKPEAPLNDRQLSALRALGYAGVLAGEAEDDVDDPRVFVLPDGTMPLEDLSASFADNWKDQAIEVAGQVHELTGMPTDGISHYLVHLNFVPKGKPSVKILPSFVELFDVVEDMGDVAINEGGL